VEDGTDWCRGRLGERRKMAAPTRSAPAAQSSRASRLEMHFECLLGLVCSLQTSLIDVNGKCSDQDERSPTSVALESLRGILHTEVVQVPCRRWKSTTLGTNSQACMRRCEVHTETV
jgi:hypothetical protein